jgi:oxalate---CoA ligase
MPTIPTALQKFKLIAWGAKNTLLQGASRGSGMSESQHVGFFRPSGGLEDIALNTRWDGTQFAQEVARRVAVLSLLNIRRGSIVAILHNGSAHFFADLFAVWRLGAAAACLDSTLTDEELRLIIEVAKPVALLVDRRSVADVASIPVIELDTAPTPSFSAPAVAAVPQDPALVLFTSGTTAEPKGVVLSFRALWARLSANIDAIGTVNLARTLVTLPTHFGHGLIGNALTPLMAGGDIVLHPPGLFLSQNLSRVIDEHRITFMSSVPALWRAATRGNPPAGSTLARVHVGSSPLSAKLWSDIAHWTRAEVVNCYGLTETANWVAGASSHSEGIADGLLGIPWGCTVAVLDGDGTIRKSGEGELLVKSPAVMSGYLARPDLTKMGLSNGWLHTGDRGRVDDRGWIWFSGRMKDQINRAGFKIEPAEIDLLLERHPAVAEACVFGIPDPISGEAVVAAVRLAEGASASPPGLKSWCLQHLRREAVPERFYIVDAIQRTPVGKVSRDAVRRSFIHSVCETNNQQGEIAGATFAASNDATSGAVVVSSVHKIVERAWAAVLGDSALELSWEAGGGDSISTLRLLFYLEQDLGARLPLDMMNAGTKLDELTAAIEKIRVAQTPLPPPRVSDQRSVVFFLPPAQGDLPVLARFRATLANEIRFVVTRYPSWREMIRKGGSFDTMVEAAFAQIRAQSDSDIYFLAGYSFGGIVAYEVARRLAQSGGRIGFLGLIDAQGSGNRAPRRAENLLTKSVRRLKRTLAQPTHAIRVLPRRLIASLASLSAYRSLIAIGKLTMALSPKMAFEWNWHLTAHVRMKALRRWTIKPLDVSATLFRSEEDLDPLGYGWSAQCPRLTVVTIPGTHLSLFEPPNREVLCTKFLQMVEAASNEVHNDNLTQHSSREPVSALLR